MVRVVNYKKQKGGINIMRPSVFGNPFDVKQLGINREESIARFKVWMLEHVANQTGIYEDLVDLRKQAQNNTITLVCCCKPLACHGDVIKDWIENV